MVSGYNLPTLVEGDLTVTIATKDFLRVISVPIQGLEIVL